MTTSIELSGKTALVTGATSGIGRATSMLLADRGAYVVVSGRNEARGDAVVSEIRAAGGKADFVSAELCDADSVRSLARDAIDLGGGTVDILVNNAGVFPFGPTPGPATRTSTPSTPSTSRLRSFSLAPLRPAWLSEGRGRSSTS